MSQIKSDEELNRDSKLAHLDGDAFSRMVAGHLVTDSSIEASMIIGRQATYIEAELISGMSDFGRGHWVRLIVMIGGFVKTRVVVTMTPFGEDLFLDEITARSAGPDRAFIDSSTGVATMSQVRTEELIQFGEHVGAFSSKRAARLVAHAILDRNILRLIEALGLLIANRVQAIGVEGEQLKKDEFIANSNMALALDPTQPMEVRVEAANAAAAFEERMQEYKVKSEAARKYTEVIVAVEQFVKNETEEILSQIRGTRK